jgi:hypothetical protein
MLLLVVMVRRTSSMLPRAISDRCRCKNSFKPAMAERFLATRMFGLMAWLTGSRLAKSKRSLRRSALRGVEQQRQRRNKRVLQRNVKVDAEHHATCSAVMLKRMRRDLQHQKLQRR